eukprot:CAMPEP_0181212882 /NCGR_PEP_ID=MMETSP1096-20121128/24601_1 /TAXON_ID=156174 ORGANISM="Chrysochromulina ericina, Strain CCMP281" /NCGR_SAMPLE_ID=MMETSP1096 /ASSEMBLY_ACC=CAM_ASM_000453 /LENGTH=206 /DNA_ID=CAMNT_0023304469 /DNA_START=188 /DNA_END=808 /DNA_ORIENTATION=+
MTCGFLSICGGPVSRAATPLNRAKVRRSPLAWRRLHKSTRCHAAPSAVSGRNNPAAAQSAASLASPVLPASLRDVTALEGIVGQVVKTWMPHGARVRAELDVDFRVEWLATVKLVHVAADLRLCRLSARWGPSVHIHWAQVGTVQGGSEPAATGTEHAITKHAVLPSLVAGPCHELQISRSQDKIRNEHLAAAAAAVMSRAAQAKD